MGPHAGMFYAVGMQMGQRAILGGNRASDRSDPAPVVLLREAALEKAIGAERFDIRFQPQFDLRTDRIVGVEALARWDGAENPEALFTLAAQAGLDERLSRALQRQALRMAGRWSGTLQGLRLSINLLPKDLERPGFERWLLDEIAAAGLSPTDVTAEIVETSLMTDRCAVSERLAVLRSAGVRIAIDDFGTGYSCLAYLTSLPIDMIKIDRAMIADIVGGTRHQILVKAMARMAHDLGLTVLVEGVESRAQLDLLREWGCDLYQGFLGAKALSETALKRFVTNREA